eukprot:m51a1_g12035 hypothetical protein (816) ;mRNA; f:1988-6460
MQGTQASLLATLALCFCAAAAAPPATLVVDDGAKHTLRLQTISAAEPDATALLVAHANTSVSLHSSAVRSNASSTDLSASIETTGTGAAGVFASGSGTQLRIAGSIATTGPHSPCVALAELAERSASVWATMRTSGAHSPVVHVARGSHLTLDYTTKTRVVCEAAGPASPVALVDGASLQVWGGTHVAAASSAVVVRPGSDVQLVDAVLQAGEEAVLVDGTAGREGSAKVHIQSCALHTSSASACAVRVVAATASVTLSSSQAHGSGALLVAQNSSAVALVVERGSGDVVADETSKVAVWLSRYSGAMQGPLVSVALDGFSSSWNVTGTSRIRSLSATQTTTFGIASGSSAVVCSGPVELGGGYLVLRDVDRVPPEPRVLIHSDAGVRGTFGIVTFEPLSDAVPRVEVVYTANDVMQIAQAALLATLALCFCAAFAAPPATLVVDDGAKHLLRLVTVSAAEPDATALLVAHANTSVKLAVNCAVRSSASSTDLSASAAEGLCAAVRVVDGAALSVLPTPNNSIATTGAGAAGLFASGSGTQLSLSGSVATTGPHSPCVALAGLTGPRALVTATMRTSGAHSPVVHVAQGSRLTLQSVQRTGVFCEATGPASPVALVDSASLLVQGGTHVAAASSAVVVRPGSDVLLERAVLQASDEAVLVDGTAGRGGSANVTVVKCALQTSGGASAIRVAAATASVTLYGAEVRGSGALLVAQNGSAVALEMEEGSGDVVADETSSVAVHVRRGKYSGALQGPLVSVAIGGNAATWSVAGSSRVRSLAAGEGSVLELAGPGSTVVCSGPVALGGGWPTPPTTSC